LLEKEFIAFFFIVCGFLEYASYLLVSFFLGLSGEEVVSVAVFDFLAKAAIKFFSVWLLLNSMSHCSLD